MKQAAVIGHPISHSLSPAIFGFLAERLSERDLNYGAIDVPPHEIESFILKVKEKENWLGFNVTIPHKERLLGLVDELTRGARAVGAVNVVQRTEGRLIGYNTDVLGIEDTFRDENLSLNGERVLIIGAGGAARAAAFAVATAGATEVSFVNRTAERAAIVVSEFSTLFTKTKFSSMGTRDLPSESKLVIQATPLGMSGVATDAQDTEVFKKALSHQTRSQGFAFDLVYRPEETPFLKIAKNQGLKTLTGLAMLIGQALATWEIWLGPIAEKKKLKAELTTFLRARLKEAL